MICEVIGTSTLMKASYTVEEAWTAGNSEETSGRRLRFVGLVPGEDFQVRPFSSHSY